MLLTHGHLLLLLLLSGNHGGVSLLLLEESEGLVGLLVQVLEVGHELDWVDDTLVVEQHARDLASHVAVGLLDHAEDGISDLLSPVCRLQLGETSSVDRGKYLLLLLLHGSHLLLLLLLLLLCELHLGHLFGCHLHGCWVDRRGAISLHVFAIATCRSHVVASGVTTAIVEFLATWATVLAALITTSSLETSRTLLTVHGTVVLHA